MGGGKLDGLQFGWNLDSGVQIIQADIIPNSRRKSHTKPPLHTTLYQLPIFSDWFYIIRPAIHLPIRIYQLKNIYPCKFSKEWVYQSVPQICTASAYLYRKCKLKQMQYRFAVNFWTLILYIFFLSIFPFYA